MSPEKMFATSSLTPFIPQDCALTPENAMLKSGSGGPQLVRAKLDNGLEILIIPDRRAPVVTHMLWYRNGSSDDPVGKSGIAHFLEHLMFKGTEKYPHGTFDQAIAAVGGWQNAFTSNDYTAYIQRVAPQHLATMMEMEADRMTGLMLQDDVVASERNVVIEERRMHVEADPSSLMFESMSAALFTRHPYGIPIIGFMHEIEGLEREDALSFYQHFYTPNNAAVVIAGDIDPDEAIALVKKIYGAIAPSKNAPSRFRPQEPVNKASRHVSLSDPKVEQPLVYRIYTTASENVGDKTQVRALEVLSKILGEGSTSRLYKNLVMERGLAASAGSFYHSMRLNQGMFGLYAYPKEGVSLEELDQAMEDVLQTLTSEGISEAELKRAKTLLVSKTIYKQDNQYSLAYHYGQALCLGIDINTLAGWPDEINAVSTQAVSDAAREGLSRTSSATGYLLPSSTEKTEKSAPQA